MEYGTYVRDFFKLLTYDDCTSNELLLPAKFCDMHREHLGANWILSIRNGYKINVVYDEDNRKLLGLGDFFNDFALFGGEVLIFEYVDSTKFNVSIINEDCNEIQYPSVVHWNQTSSPVTVSRKCGDWKFIKFISVADPIIDEIKPPGAFMGYFRSTIPEWFTYRLRNHYIFGGHYDFFERKLSGLRSISEGLRLPDFNKLELLVFTYDGGRNFKLSLFDGTNVEIGLDLTAVTTGNLVYTFRNPCFFNIEVKPSHMLTYCHGVDIPVQFKRLTDLWKSKDTLHVFSGSLSWEFEIRKRSRGKRPCIHAGWITFRNDFELAVGDVCYFRWMDECYHRFRVEIVKSAIVHV